MAVDKKLDYLSNGVDSSATGLILSAEDCKELGGKLEVIVVEIHRRCALDKEDYMRKRPFKVFGRTIFHYKVLDSGSYLSDVLNDYIDVVWVRKEPIPYLSIGVHNLMALESTIRNMPGTQVHIGDKWLIEKVQHLLGK